MEVRPSRARQLRRWRITVAAGSDGFLGIISGGKAVSKGEVATGVGGLRVASSTSSIASQGTWLGLNELARPSQAPLARVPKVGGTGRRTPGPTRARASGRSRSAGSIEA